jgi:5-methylcytosine-specific restriction endonuclease McrA
VTKRNTVRNVRDVTCTLNGVDVKHIAMQRHTKIYMDFYQYGIDDLVPCVGCNNRAVDVHHIDARGMGGDPTGRKDVIENLVALCRRCHNNAEFNKEFNDLIKRKHLTRLRLWKATH